MSPNAPIETFEQMKELISVDTLKAIQLLGFNYKAAFAPMPFYLNLNQKGTL